MTHLHPDVACTATEDGMILLDERDGRYWQLNATGAAVVEALVDGATPRQIADRLAATRPVDRQRACDDVTALLTQLTRAGLVVDPA
ncbi:lasso peptide biosynthesis PqqD family chaperone [Streptomyces marispadix]|uniref:Lasso peptide biosynthesis PqqD family chaperone n=1 Tax=Streptomyces marispadix TaxID=2922868 RepID=A0ABS9SSQ2_9ACTN|nr:lasso peptide biosynthesis PqqD family chaperone [Streptomyces marispadix]MCH6159223.1 lasso peptide biosynthesis PqqD family chaperone [Streptomyces marispadix]